MGLQNGIVLEGQQPVNAYLNIKSYSVHKKNNFASVNMSAYKDKEHKDSGGRPLIYDKSYTISGDFYENELRPFLSAVESKFYEYIKSETEDYEGFEDILDE